MGIVGLTVLARERPGPLRRHGERDRAGAATRLTATIPRTTRSSRGPRPRKTRRVPDNIAPIVTYLASTESDWLTGRTLGASGHEIRLWNNPEVIASVQSTGAWDLDDLAARVEKEFRPLADGLHPSIFMAQIPA